MKKGHGGLLTIAALALAVSAPLRAQNISLSAVIPFDFIAGNKTLPAGEYTVRSASAPQTLQIRNHDLRTASVVMAASTTHGDSVRTGDVRLVFSRYGNHYVLAQVWDGLDAVRHDLTKSRTESELAKTASSAKVEVLGLLARR